MSKSHQIIYTPESLDDLRDIHTYIAFRLHEPSTARRLLQRIRNEIHSLKEMPEQCQLVDWEPWHSIGIRYLPVGNYLVYYEVNKADDIVYIDRVFYGGRDVEQMAEDG